MINLFFQNLIIFGHYIPFPHTVYNIDDVCSETTLTLSPLLPSAAVITYTGASFEDVHISNVRSGSSFGGVTYDHTGTYGGFGNGFWADNRFGLSGGALTNFNDLVVENITAENIKKTNVLDDYATNASLNAINKKIQSLDESKINISDLTWKSITYVSELKTRPVYVITAADGSKGESVRVVSEHTSSNSIGLAVIHK